MWPFKPPIPELNLATMIVSDNIAEEFRPTFLAKAHLCLQNVQAGIIDPYADQELVLDLTHWAMGVAKGSGARSPREAWDWVRGVRVSNAEWLTRKDGFEFLWPSLDYDWDPQAKQYVD